MALDLAARLCAVLTLAAAAARATPGVPGPDAAHHVRASPPRPLSVAALDGSMSVHVDKDTGMVTHLEARGVELLLSAGSTLAGTLALQVTVTKVRGLAPHRAPHLPVLQR